jgi:hypothetical protein
MVRCKRHYVAVQLCKKCIIPVTNPQYLWRQCAESQKEPTNRAFCDANMLCLGYSSGKRIDRCLVTGHRSVRSKCKWPGNARPFGKRVVGSVRPRSSPGGLPGSAFDFRAVDTDILQRPIVEVRQLPHGSAIARPGAKRGNKRCNPHNSLPSVTKKSAAWPSCYLVARGMQKVRVEIKAVARRCAWLL